MVSTTENRVVYDCTGGTTYDFDFPVFDGTTDLKVTRTSAEGVDTELTLTTDYTVEATDNDWENGGTVTTVSTYSDGKITIERVIEATQEVDYIEGDRFSAETHERALDRLTMLIQQLEDRVGRQITFPASDDTDLDYELPNAIVRGSCYLGFNAEGEPIASPGIPDVPMSTWGETLVDDESADDALTTLGVSEFAKTLLDDADAETARATLGAAEAHAEVITSSQTAASRKKYLVTAPVNLALPTSPAAGDELTVVADAACNITQSDADHSIAFRNSFFTTKGTTGLLKLFPGEKARMIYKGTGLSRIEPGVKLSDPGGLPAGHGIDCAFSYDGTYLAVGHYTSPHLTIYKRSGDTFTKLADPGDLPAGNGSGCAFSYDGTYLAVAHVTTPYITIYKRSGDTFTKLDNPAILPTGTGYDCAFSYDGTYLAVGHYTSPHLTIYKRSGDTFTKLADPATLPAGNGNGCAFSCDGTYLAVAHATSPYLTIYKRSGDTFTKLADPGDLPAGNGYGCAFSYDGTYLAVAHDTSPYITIYKNAEAVTKQWIVTDLVLNHPPDPSDGDNGDLPYRFV